MSRLGHYIGILICVVFFMSSCIKEDIIGCKPDGTILQFTLVPYEENNISNDSLYSATLYAFNEKNILAAIYTIPEKPELNKVYTTDWILPPGKYHFSVWLNYTDKMLLDLCVIEQTMRHHEMLQLKIPNNKIIGQPDKIPFLCYGYFDNKEVDSSDVTSHIKIPVMQLTNNINLRVIGLKQSYSPLTSSIVENRDYIFTIVDNNDVYKLNADLGVGNDFTYSRSGLIESDTLETSLTVMRLLGTRPNPVISLNNLTTGENLFPENLTNSLISLILSKYPNNDFDKNHDYYIEVDSEQGKEIIVTVTINDWAENLSDTELNINK